MKHYLKQDVLEAAKERLRLVFRDFEKVCVSFSGGKDSGVLLNLAIDVARELGKLPVTALLIDLEGQYKHTVDYAQAMMSREEVDPYWVCLPLHLRNAVSQFQPHWVCWDPDKKDLWIRDLPPKCIVDPSYFPFFRKGMEFEEFVPEFAKWFSKGKPTASLVGIRADESLNRYRTIANEKKVTYKDKQWSTKLFPKDEASSIYNFYPMYDWRTSDVWVANGRCNYAYNKVYDLMHKAGLSIDQMRLCQPYGDDQRKGLYLYKILEPDTWARGSVKGGGCQLRQPLLGEPADDLGASQGAHT